MDVAALTFWSADTELVEELFSPLQFFNAAVKGSVNVRQYGASPQKHEVFMFPKIEIFLQ